MQMQSMVRAIVGFAAFSSVSALALFDAELLYGRRWYDVKPKQGSATGVNGTDVSLAAHVDHIPLVPVAFGASFAMVDLNLDDLGGNFSEAKIVEPAFDIKAWIPMVPFVTPYVKIKFPISDLAKFATKASTETEGVKTEETKLYKLSGYHLNAGIAYSPLPLIKILFEGGLGMEKASADEIKQGGIKLPTAEQDLDMNSKYLAVGLAVGL